MRHNESRVHVRWMIRRDMANLLPIENRSFKFPWTKVDFSRCLQHRNCIGMVVERNGVLAGYMIYELHKNRIHLLRLAVSPEHRDRSVGRALVHKLVGKLSHERRNRIMIEVRETNLAAQLFFQTFGFKVISILRDYYEERTGHVEDAYMMELRYQTPAAEASKRRPQISRMDE